jgi:hypothetical protein
MAGADDQRVRIAVDGLQGAATSFGTMFIQDAAARGQYIELTRKFAEEIWANYQSGKLSAQQAADAANGMRNEIMEMIRARSSPVGRARAEQLKAKGLRVDELVEKYAQKKFGKAFAELAETQKTEVFEEIVKAAGRANPKVSAGAARMGALGRVLWVVSIGVSVYQISIADDKMRETLHQVTILGGGALGGWATGALVGIWFGPEGALIGGLIGGVLSAILADEIFDAVDPVPGI